jgi:hypothetical protein
MDAAADKQLFKTEKWLREGGITVCWGVDAASKMNIDVEVIIFAERRRAASELDDEQCNKSNAGTSKDR